MKNDDLSRILNLGEKTALWLNEAGIHTRVELEQLGGVEACRRIMLSGRELNVLMLYAIEGGLRNLHWNKLSGSLKLELKQEFQAMKKEMGL